MNFPFQASANEKPRRIVSLVAAAVGLGYALGHLGWYLTTPLGRVPVLDERENLDLAEAIFHGTLPAEPFYRAPGYACLLAALRWLGVTAAALFPAALVLGTGLHAVNAGLAALLAFRWFGTRAAGWAGLLTALNPVLVHYATQALDATLALTCFLFGLHCLAGALEGRPASRRWAGASLSWAAATLVRPNFLLLWAGLPLAAAGTASAGTARIRWVAAALAGGGLFATVALWQYKVSGTAGFLPWQGAYNLWAANRPGANGRFYTQHLSLPRDQARINPARAESFALYQQETGQPAGAIGPFNAYWDRKFIAEVTGHPGRWTALITRKAYALGNNWEQYNNKTYAFHKARSPWLAWNPLGWGVLFIPALAGSCLLAARSPRRAVLLGVVAGSYAATVLLFFVSARFRLPLAVLAAILAGGALGEPLFWRGWRRTQRLLLAVLLLVGGVWTFSRWGGVADPGTFVQDHVLLARAAYTVGEDRLAQAEAEAALALQPGQPDAIILRQEAREQLSRPPGPPP